MFASMEGWESIGFKPPRIRASVEEAIACMGKHHIDAIAVDKDQEFAALNAHLDEHCPVMPIFEIESRVDEQFTTLGEVYQLLTQTHADYSNDDYGEAYYFQLARERWMKQLISGKMATTKQVITHHRLFRCEEAVDAPCIYAKLSVPSGDVFLSGRWHYGSERLEIALRNFFCGGHEKMIVHLAVFSPEEVRVLVCPKPEYADSADFSEALVRDYLKKTISEIEEYLGLKMNVMDIRTLENLTAFAQGTFQG
jgi:hypothetical protein